MSRIPKATPEHSPANAWLEGEIMVEATERKIVSLDLEKATEWLAEHWKGDRICGICGNRQWTGHDTVMEVRSFDGGRLGGPGQVTPLLVLVCSTCGNTLFFNAILAGLVERPESQ